VLDALSYRQRDWDEEQGRAAEARGLEIAVTLQAEEQDARYVAGWIRDGWKKVPKKSAKHITKERVTAAMRRLKAIGLLRRVGDSWRIR
jgi:hypothetical protein